MNKQMTKRFTSKINFLQFFDVNYLFFFKNEIDIFLSCFQKISINMDAFQFFSQDQSCK